MPKATAVWLVENTALTFEQISAFCGLHDLEVQAIADGEVATGMQGLDPIAGGELTQEELDRCVADPDSRMEMAKPNIPLPKARTKGARYTPLSKRQDRPDAIAWLVRNQPEFSDSQISKLIGTTKTTINAIRERSHWNMSNIKPQNPVNLGLCSSDDLEKAVALARARAGKAKESQTQPLDGVGTVLARTKGARYTPLSKRQDRPDAIAWLVRNQPEFSDSQISKLIGTTKTTINAIRERSHWNMSNIKPQNPVNTSIEPAHRQDHAGPG